MTDIMKAGSFPQQIEQYTIEYKQVPVVQTNSLFVLSELQMFIHSKVNLVL